MSEPSDTSSHHGKDHKEDEKRQDDNVKAGECDTSGRSGAFSFNPKALAFTPKRIAEKETQNVLIPMRAPSYEHDPSLPMKPQFLDPNADRFFDPYDDYESFVSKYQGYSQDEMIKYFGQIHGTYEQSSSRPKPSTTLAFGAQTPSKTPKKPDSAPVLTYDLPFGKAQIPFGSPLYQKLLQQKGMDGEPQEEREVIIQPWDIQGVRRQHRTLDSVQTPIGTTVDFHQFINISCSIRNIIKTTEELVFKMAYHVPDDVYSKYVDFLDNSRQFLDHIKQIDAGRGTDEAGLRRSEIQKEVVEEGLASKSNIDEVHAQLEKQLSLAPSDRKRFGSSTDDSREIGCYESVDPGAPSSSGQVSYSAAAARNLSELAGRKTEEQVPKAHAKPLPTSSLVQRKTPLLSNIVQTEPKTPSTPKRDEHGFEFPTPKRTARRVDEQVTPKRAQDKPPAPTSKLVTMPVVRPETPDLTNEEIAAMSEDEFDEEVAESERREKVKHRMGILRFDSTKERLIKQAAEDREKHMKKKIKVWTERLIVYKLEHEKREAVRSVQMELSKSDPTEYVRRVRALPPFQQDVVRCFNAARRRPQNALKRATDFAESRIQVYKDDYNPIMVEYWTLILKNMDEHFADDVNYLRAVGEFYKVENEELKRFDRCYINLVFNKQPNNRIESRLQDIKSSDPAINVQLYRSYIRRREKWIRIGENTFYEADYDQLPEMERYLFDEQRVVEGYDPVQAWIHLAQMEMLCIRHGTAKTNLWARVFNFLKAFPSHIISLDVACIKELAANATSDVGNEATFMCLMFKYFENVFGIEAGVEVRSNQ